MIREDGYLLISNTEDLIPVAEKQEFLLFTKVDEVRHHQLPLNKHLIFLQIL